MALSRSRRYEAVNYWPGFVDALSTMLLVIIFLLSVFMLAQFFLSQEVTGKDEALAKLNRQIEELTNLLALERTQKGADETKISTLTATLDSAEQEQKRLKDAASQGAVDADAASGKASAAAMALDQQKQISAQALAQVDVLNQQIAALRRQLAGDRGRARRLGGRQQGIAIEDLRPRPAAQRRAGAEGSGAQSLPLRLFRPPAPDPRLAARHPGRRRPVRVRILGAVRRRQGRHQPGRAASRSIRSLPPSSTSSARFRPTCPGSCGSTAIPTIAR